MSVYLCQLAALPRTGRRRPKTPGSPAGRRGSPPAISAFDQIGFGRVLHKVRFSFGEYGGNVNVSVSNTLASIDNFTALNNQAPGDVTITVVSGGFGNDKGIIDFGGPMPDQDKAWALVGRRSGVLYR